jgi:hypothetical protein
LFLSDDNDIRLSVRVNIRVNKTLNLQHIQALIFGESPTHADGAVAVKAGEKSPLGQFSVPFMFQPELTLSQAFTAALRAFLRIILGSILFGVWGAYALLVWTSISNPVLRVAAMIPMIALFLVLLCGLLIATTLLLRPRARPTA